MRVKESRVLTKIVNIGSEGINQRKIITIRRNRVGVLMVTVTFHNTLLAILTDLGHFANYSHFCFCFMAALDFGVLVF